MLPHSTSCLIAKIDPNCICLVDRTLANHVKGLTPVVSPLFFTKFAKLFLACG